ncbi:MAG: APC family permease [Streptosporangiaceae bacterium]
MLFTGVGSIIGSGWLFGSFNASQQAGPSAIFAWIIGGVMFMIIGIVYAELGVMFPVAGGVVRFPQYSHGSFAGYSNGWASWLAAAAVTPIEVLASVGYATPYLPWLMVDKPGGAVLSGAGFGVSVGLMLLYSLINVMGVKAFARFNNVLVWWKLVMIVLVIVVFFAVTFHPENLTTFGGFAPYGESALFASLPAAGVAFAYLGFRQGVEFAGETDNPQRNVPFAVIGSILITMVIYVALQIAFITSLPGGKLQGGWANLGYASDAGPLAGLSMLLGVAWLAYLLYADAIISPADTGLIYAGVTARLGYANGRNANAPRGSPR